MKKYFLLSFLLLASCKQEQTEVTTTDSTSVSVIPGETETPSLPSTNDTIATPPVTDTISREKGRQLLPVDEASKDPGFLQFRNQLLSAVRAKNGDAVMKVLDSNIRLSFGGSGGLTDFRRMWKPNDKTSPLWQKLEWVLAHGGSFKGTGADRMFWAPYVYSKWPDDGPDAFENGAIVGRVSVYEKADTNSAIVAILDHHFVKVLDRNHLKEKQPQFVKIQTPSGKTGYVRSTQIRSQLDYRAGFDKRSGEWKMSLFVAGD